MSSTSITPTAAQPMPISRTVRLEAFSVRGEADDARDDHEREAGDHERRGATQSSSDPEQEANASDPEPIV